MSSEHWRAHCINQRGQATDTFIKDYLGSSKRKILLIGGAGFDPRATAISEKLSLTNAKVSAIYLREDRPNPNTAMLRRAEANIQELQRYISDSNVMPMPVFANDGAIIGGRRSATLAAEVNIEGCTDIVIDFSALSKGIAFPLIKCLLQRITIGAPELNLHILLVDEPETDSAIKATGSDKADAIHGFKGQFGLAQTAGAAKLWLPQVGKNQLAALQRLFVYIRPHDVCPIFAFPSGNPRSIDELLVEYSAEIESTWEVDPGNLIYASEGRPLDLYRTILQLDDERKRIFEGLKGSQTILSPLGSKAASIGILMAAITRDFPVIHVEAIAYDIDGSQNTMQHKPLGDIVHVWLSGEAYKCL